MKLLKICIVFFCLPIFSFSQNYIRGIIKDEKGNAVSYAKIKFKSTKQIPYSNGSDGSFGFDFPIQGDSMFITQNGFEPLTIWVSSKQYNSITLKAIQETKVARKKGLASKTKDLEYEVDVLIDKAGESYSGLIENDFIKTNKNPETGFGITVDRAAYSNIRRMINNEMKVLEDAVRIEEMLNYFDFKDSVDAARNNFSCKTSLTTCPWNKNHQLFYVNTSVPKINLKDVPPCNLVFLIDISGSMERPNRLPLLQAAFKILVDNLRPIDKVAIVTYGGGVEVELPSTSGANKATIKNVIDELVAMGDTPGAGAITTAYAEAKKSFVKNGNNRVILATDGDFNVGQTSDKELEDIITQQRQGGTYLTCIGVGMGNYKDSKLETLAKKGNGNFAYLDDIQEAEKVFMQEFTKTIYTVAKDALVNVSFNKDAVKEYRLIGYDNKREAIEDTSNILTGGEVGSGHNAIAVFEIETWQKTKANLPQIATVNFQYKTPTNDTLKSIQHIAKFDSAVTIERANHNLKLAASICMLGSIFKGSKYIKGIDFDDINTLLEPSTPKNNVLQQEFLNLLVKSENIYHINKKKKKKKKK